MLLMHEVVFSLASENPGSWLGFEAERNLARELADWSTRVGLSADGPPLAAVVAWGDTAPYNTCFDSLLLLL